jgi:DNA-binding SARP family transcriptional activator
MGRLLLSFLGPFQAMLDGLPVTGFESNKVRALLAYLVVEADRPHARSALAGLLWPEWPDRAALSNLRYALSNLRQTIGDRQAQPHFLLITRDTIQFNTASDYGLDVATFTRYLAVSYNSLLPNPHSTVIGYLQSAALLYRASFLEGFSLSDSPAFEEWVLFKREQFRQRMSSALGNLAAYYTACGEYDQAAAYARLQIELDPWREEAHQQLMRALMLTGQRSAALIQYEICRRSLAQELDIKPSRETEILYERIRDDNLP